ncbi:hypothetical protein SAMN03159489_05673 [Pseudomonas sp. NFPP07]|nr:hypothetical protein SAMN03159489_05673 [Pseudomonas sp. NFPP07]
MPAQPKVTKRSRPWRTAFASLRFPRSGVHQGASTPVGFASTSIRCPRLRRGALRACPLMNTSTRPPDGAGRSRSKAKAKAAPCATYRSALNFVAAAEPARLRSAAQRTQGLETAGGPSVLSQPAAAATGVVSVSSCMELSESEVLPDRAAGSRSKAAPCATCRSALNPVAAAEPARLRSAAQRTQGLETAGGPSVLSQPRRLGSGYRPVISALFVGASLLAIRSRS